MRVYLLKLKKKYKNWKKGKNFGNQGFRVIHYTSITMYDKCVFLLSVKKLKRDEIFRKFTSKQIKRDLVAIAWIIAKLERF